MPWWRGDVVLGSIAGMLCEDLEGFGGVVLAGYSLSMDNNNKRGMKKNERIMAKTCQI